MTSRAHHRSRPNRGRPSSAEAEQDLYPGIPTPAELLFKIDEAKQQERYERAASLQQAYEELTNPPATQHRWQPAGHHSPCPMGEGYYKKANFYHIKCSICWAESRITPEQEEQMAAFDHDEVPISDDSWRDDPGPHRCATVHLARPLEYSEPSGFWLWKTQQELPRTPYCGRREQSWKVNFKHKLQGSIYRMSRNSCKITTVNCVECLTLAEMTRYITPEAAANAELVKAASQQRGEQVQYLPKGRPRRASSGPERYLDHA